MIFILSKKILMSKYWKSQVWIFLTAPMTRITFSTHFPFGILCKAFLGAFSRAWLDVKIKRFSIFKYYWRKSFCKKLLDDLNSFKNDFGVKIMKTWKSKFFLLNTWWKWHFEYIFLSECYVEPFREHFCIRYLV